MGDIRLVGRDNTTPVAVTPSGALAVDVGGTAPASADVVAGTAVATNSTTPVTLITVPAGRTWRGNVMVGIASTAAAIVAATVDVNGTGSPAPASGAVVARVQTGGLTSGAFNEAATIPVVVKADASNAATLRLVATSAVNNTCSASANGILT